MKRNANHENERKMRRNSQEQRTFRPKKMEKDGSCGKGIVTIEDNRGRGAEAGEGLILSRRGA